MASVRMWRWKFALSVMPHSRPFRRFVTAFCPPFVPLSHAARRHDSSPVNEGASPLRRFAPALPRGEPSVRPWVQANFMVRQTKKRFLLLYGHSKRSRFWFEAPTGARPQGAGGTSMGGGRDSIKTMRGQPFGRPRRGTLSFVTQKFFCFGAINNRRNYWWVIPLCRHRKRVEHFGPIGFDAYQPLISIPVMVRPALL